MIDFSFYKNGPGLFEFSKDLQPIVQQIGGLVIAHGWLESELAALLRHMLHLSEEHAPAVLGHLDARDYVNVLKTYGFAIRPSDEWYKRLAACLNEIDNVIRLERNRMIHDVWMSEGGQMLRMDPAPKLKRPQSHREQELIVNKPQISAREISDLTERTLKARSSVSELLQEFVRESSRGTSPR